MLRLYGNAFRENLVRPEHSLKILMFSKKEDMWGVVITRTFRSNAIDQAKPKFDWDEPRSSVTMRVFPVFPHVSRAYKADEVRKYSPFRLPRQTMVERVLARSDDILNWGRRNSLLPVTFGLQMMHYSGRRNYSTTCTKPELENKVVVITGGADGIGLEIADKYLQHGAKLTYLLDINEELGAAALKKLTCKYGENKAIFRKCDVITDLPTISKWIFDCHKVDILVNNAGLLTERKLRKLIECNVIAVLEWGLTFWEHMRKDKGGNGGLIINLSSIYGYRVDQFLPVYQTSKFAVMGFTKCLGHRANCERSCVRVIAICPGFTYSKMTENPITWDLGQEEEFRAHIKAQDWQKLDSVGIASLDVLDKPTATAWLTEGARPIEEVAKFW